MAGASPTADEQRLCDRLTVRADIKRHFRSHIVRQGDKFPDANDELSKHYIRAEDIQEAWSGIGTLNKALYPSVLAEHVAIIKDRFLILLSILVSLDAHAYLDQFGSYLSDGNGSMLRTNNQLPLKYDDIPNLGNPDLQERFFEEQYKFAPIVIYEASEPAVIENDKRLPFEAYSAEMSEGAFGQVQKVTISKQHFVTEAGVMASNTTVVALKRFPSRPGSLQDSKKELNNLEVLKKSITKHRYIRTHLAAFFYRSEHIILLPWADRYDLHLFLLEGHDQWEKKIYDFDTIFGDPSQDDIVRDSYKQLVNIAAALKWLHEDVRPLNKHLYFAHMDLKPDNILIDNDDHDRSTVGKWVLTDFGISAFKESTEQEDDKYVSIRDYVERKNLTMDTSARRYEGAYQPPEMERRDQVSGGPGNQFHRRRAGRRGDIWSFGCIFSEVIAFCVGRSEEVIAFRNARRENYGNDYFYQTLTVTGSSLFPGGLHVTHRLRPEMMEWLKNTSNKLLAPTVTNAVLRSSVDKISEILVIEGPAPEDPKRPRASQLLRIMDDLKSLFDKPFEKEQDCAPKNLKRSAQPPLATGREDGDTSTVNLPTIIDPSPQLLINAQKDHSFKHAAVDDDTGFLYMWSSETSIETLQIWRLESAKEDLNIVFDSAQNYNARTNGGDFKATIFPFHGRKGCVVRLDGDDFICSPSSMSRDTLALNPVRPSTKIRERLITQNDHEIRREPQPFKIAVNASMDAIDSMRVVRMPNTEDLNIIVITKAGKIFFVPITA
ncbi:kinase-like protein [Lizonia empirigonia]|nr:kinase-like protein [Lizonia empirigonia]